MKRIIFLLLLTMVILTGCSAATVSPTVTKTPEASMKEFSSKIASQHYSEAYVYFSPDFQKKESLEHFITTLGPVMYECKTFASLGSYPSPLKNESPDSAQLVYKTGSKVEDTIQLTLVKINGEWKLNDFR